MYIHFLRSTEGEGTVLLIAVLILAGLITWGRRHSDRLLVLGMAAVLTALVASVYVLALWGGWWTGAYFELPAVEQGAILLPLALLFGTLWLAGYRWLADNTRQPLQIYVAVTLLVVLAVAVAHRLNLGQGQIVVGPGYAVVVEAALAMLVLWPPVLAYEALRRNLERFEPIP